MTYIEYNNEVCKVQSQISHGRCYVDFLKNMASALSTEALEFATQEDDFTTSTWFKICFDELGDRFLTTQKEYNKED